MKYYEEGVGFEEDGLLGGTEFPTELYNVSISSGASLSRGDLICGSSMSGVFAPVSSASDASKILMIANEDFTATSLSAVTSAYSAGVFNREKIICAGGSIADFEQELRKQGIWLTSLK